MSGRLHVVALGLLLAVAALLRLHRLGEGLWLDEVLTYVNYARLPFAEIVRTYNDQNQHMLYSLTAHAAFTVFGESAWALRLPAALFGVASIYAAHLFGRQITSRGESFLAAALLTFSFQHVWFSQNARAYTALLFFSLISSHLLLKAMRNGDARSWALYAISVALGMYSHLTMMFMVAGQFAFWAWERFGGARDLRRAWMAPLTAFAGAVALTLALYAPVLPQLLGPGLNEETEARIWLNPLWTLTETIARLQLGIVFGAGLVLGAVVLAVGFASYLRQRPALLAVFAAPAIVGGGVTIALQHPLWPRFFFFAAGFAMLIVVRGIVACSRTGAGWLGVSKTAADRLAVVMASAAVVVSALALPRAYGPKQDYEGARDFVAAAANAGDVVATSGIAARVYSRLYEPGWPAVETPEQLRALGRDAAVWVVITMPVHMEARFPALMSELQTHFDLMRQFSGTLGDGTIYVHRSRPTWPDRQVEAPRHDH